MGEIINAPGAAPPPEVPPSPAEMQALTDMEAFFNKPLPLDPRERVQIERVNQYSPASRVGVLFARANPGSAKYLRMPISQWPIEVLQKWAIMFVSLNGCTMQDTPFGEYSVEEAQDMVGVSPTILWESLGRKFTTSYLGVTDRTLVTFLAEVRGVEITDEGEFAAMSFPGYDARVEVFLSGVNKGRVRDGGLRFVEWYNKVQKTSLVYQVSSVEARFLAIKCALLYKLEGKSDGTVTIVERKASALTDGYVGVESDPRVEVFIRTFILPLLKGALSSEGLAKDPLMRAPQVALKDPVNFFEWALVRLLGALPPGSTKAITAFVKTAGERAPIDFATIAAYMHLGKAPTDKPTNMAVASAVFNAPPIVPFTKTLVPRTSGEVWKMVGVFRAQFRNPVDVPKKSDAPGIGSIGGAATSVPVKFGSILDRFRDVGVHVMPDVDAFGTGACNHWEGALRETFGGKIMYHEVNPKYHPPTIADGDLDRLDIRMVEPGSGKGKFIMDDTCPDNLTAPVTKNFFGEKLAPILKADYEGGAIKILLGHSEFEARHRWGKDALELLPALIREFAVKYPFVELAPGGGPHSPEYFIIFGRGPKPGWKVTPEGPKWLDEIDPSANVGRMRTQYLLKVVDIIRFNVYHNFIAVSCGVGYVPPPIPLLSLPPPKIIHPNGQKGANVASSESHAIPIDDTLSMV